MYPIAHIRSDFTEKFGIPRQSGVVSELRATVIFTPDYRDPEALRGLEEFSHLWLIWGFSQVGRGGFSPTIRPPRLGGNARMGVFATRSPYRPNPLGLSAVEIAGIDLTATDGPVIHVLGADLLDGTPIYDIKPYLPYADCLPRATGGFAAEAPDPRLRVEGIEPWLTLLPVDKRASLRALLAQDPRPSYQRDPDRIYGMQFAGFDIKFQISGQVLTVLEIQEVKRQGEFQ
ncbi:MAG: tRNA (N6-threonylcarbamoyladenosine(37)-N6)-methyltransferase TrmO [Oscillospiraceae bacterium]|nr:tRNA (N6-threonylcarbamoyladenosine(37)-N6)-methyltransferase TrmO [Oscillospiraceae bacterium]